MRDLTSAKLMYLKGILFLAGGAIAAGIVLLEHPEVKVAVMMAAAVWCFSRAYYFAFYVIEHYIDSSYKYSGLWSFVLYLAGRRKR